MTAIATPTTRIQADQQAADDWAVYLAMQRWESEGGAVQLAPRE